MSARFLAETTSPQPQTGWPRSVCIGKRKVAGLKLPKLGGVDLSGLEVPQDLAAALAAAASGHCRVGNANELQCFAFAGTAEAEGRSFLNVVAFVSESHLLLAVF